MNDGSKRVKKLIERLSKIGVTQKFLRDRILPDWWDDRIADTPVGFAELAMVLSRRLGIDYKSIVADSGELKPCETMNACFKVGRMANEKSSLEWTLLFSCQVAQLLWSVCGIPKSEPVPRAGELRGILLGRSSKSWFDLADLVEYCCSMGIPVMHIAHFPSNWKRFDAVALENEGRSAIILASNRKEPAWHSFYVAHELGHISLGHTSRRVIVDKSIDIESDVKHEIEANTFAQELLTGDAERRFVARRSLSGKDLASNAKRVASITNVDPGVIVLNYAWNRKSWPVAGVALNQLSTGDNAMTIIRDALLRNISQEASEEQVEFLKRIASP